CDEVIFLDHGQIVARGTPLELTKQIPAAELRLTFAGDEAAVRRYCEAEGLQFHFAREAQVVIQSDERTIPKVIFDLNGLGAEITDIDLRKPDLEDVFLQIARRNNVVQSH